MNVSLNAHRVLSVKIKATAEPNVVHFNITSEDQFGNTSLDKIRLFVRNWSDVEKLIMQIHDEAEGLLDG